MVSSFRISRLDEEEGERHRKIRENKERLSILRVSYESLTRENRKRNHASSISLAVLIREDWIHPRTPSYYETISSAGLAMFPFPPFPPAIDVPVFALIVISWQQGNPFAARGRANRV